MSALPSAPEAGGRLARRRRERARRRRARRRLVLGGLAIVAAAVVVLAAAAATLAVLGGEDADTPAAGPGAEPVADSGAAADQDTLLLVRTGQDGAVQSVTLVAASQQRATAVLIPTGTLVTVPGVGLDRLALAGQYGGPALVQASVENLLGVAVDHLAAVDGAGMATWLDRLDGLELDVGRLPSAAEAGGQATADLAPGRQSLDGAQLARYWALGGDGSESERDSLARQKQVLAALLAKLDDPRAAGALSGGGALRTDASAEWLRRLLTRAGQADAGDAAEVSVLPVERVSGEGAAESRGSVYRPDREAIDRLRQQRLAASVPDTAHGGRLRLQVLNGVGTPGIGQMVEQRLGGGRVELVTAGNARSFDQQTTRIVVYDDAPASREAARWVRQQLGVGTIQVSRQPQSVVDVTIVVGADFEP